MTDLYSITVEDETNLLRVKGELTFATANDILEQSKVLFSPVAVLDIDLEDVTRSDSAGLSLLVEWMRSANQKNKKIMFHNIPAQMLAIATASGLDELLPLQ